MQAVDEPVDDVAREQLQVLDAGQDLGIDEARARKGVGFHAFLRLTCPTSACGTDLQQLVDQRVARDAFGLRAEVREHAVPQHRMRQRA